MTTTTVSRPSTTQAMQAASLNGNDARPSNGCKDCNKVGLAILPVVPLPVPVELRASSPGIKALDAHYVTNDLKTHWMVLRTLPAGYLYVLKPNLAWDIYVVDREGLLRLVPSLSMCPASAADQKPMSEQCKRSGDNIPAQVIAIDPDKHAAVWLAFSRYRWTEDVLKAYASNEGGCRDRRMTKLDVMAAANGSLGSNSKAQNAVRFGVPMTPNIGQVVADYADQVTRNTINGQALDLLQARSDQASQLAQAMAKISANTAGKTGAVIVLSDDLGVANTLNAARNAVQVERAAVIKTYLRHDFIHRAAAGFKSQCEKQGDIKRWNDLYSKAYSQTTLDAKFKERDDKLKLIDQRLSNLGQDWADWMRRPGMGAIFANDFDSTNLSEGMQAAIAGAACLHGAGTQAAERSLIQSWMQGDIKDEGNLLWRALAGNSKSLLSRLSDTKDLMPNGVEAVKGLWSAIDEFEKSLPADAAGMLVRLRAGSADPIATAIARLLHVSASNVGEATSALGKTGARAVLITALWAGLRVAPMRHSVTPQQAAIDAKAAGWGASAGARVQTVRKANTVSWRYNLLEATDVLAAKGGVAVMQTRFVVLQVWRKTTWVNVGEPTTVGTQHATGAPPSATPTNSTPAPTATAVSGNSVWRRFAGVLREGGGNAVLASGVLYFQVMSLSQVSKELEGSGSDGKAIELTAAYFAALAGMMSAASEITAASIQVAAKIKGVDLATVRPVLGGRVQVANFVRGAAAVGGVLGGVSGIAMMASSLSKAASLKAAGDKDAAIWTQRLAVASAAGGVAGSIGALTASSGAGSLVGGTLMGIGPAGWAILTVGIVVVGVYVAYKAAEATDDPIEAWLKQSLVGTAPTKFSPEAEIAHYNNLFQLPIEVEASGSTVMGRHSVVIRLNTQPLDAQSQLSYQLDITDTNGKTHAVTGSSMLKTGTFSSYIAPTVAPQSMGPITVFVANPKAEQGASLRITVVGQHKKAGLPDSKTGEISRTETRAIQRIRLNVKYRPLSQTDASWVLPSPEGQDLIYPPT